MSQECPGEAETLTLASGKFHAILAHLGLVTLGQALDEFVSVGGLGGLEDFFFSRVGLPVSQVLIDCPGEKVILLADVSDVVAKR